MRGVCCVELRLRQSLVSQNSYILQKCGNVSGDVRLNNEVGSMTVPGMVWYGMVWYGMVWYGLVWYDMV